MNKLLSILVLVLLIALTSLSENSSAQSNNKLCREAIRRANRCTRATCCADVEGVVNICPYFWSQSYGWVMRAYYRCNDNNNIPVVTPPPPPPPPPALPPPPANNAPPGFWCSPFNVPKGCGEEITAFNHEQSSTIGKECCESIIKLQDYCPQLTWSSFFTIPQQYCRTHY